MTQGVHLIRVLHVLTHESSRHLVQSFLGNFSAPHDSLKNDGQSGWLAEWKVLGGSMRAAFRQGQEWDMIKVTSLVFQLPESGPSYVINASASFTVIFKTPRPYVIEPVALGLSISTVVPAGHVRLRRAMGPAFSTSPPSDSEVTTVSIRVCGPVRHIDQLKLRC